MTAEEYLKEHTLDPEFVKKLGWQWDEEKIIIPYYDSKGNLLHCRYRNLNGKPKFDADPGSKMSLYAAHKIKQEQVVVLCEGEPDCARLWQEGIPAVTAGGVSSFSAKIADILKDKDVIVLMDNDKPGQDVVGKCCDALLTVGALPRVATLPDGIKDVCEYFVQGATEEEFNDVISAAKTYDEWEEAQQPEKFNIISGEDILQRDLPPQEWLIDRMVPVEGFTFIVGSEGSGKSFNALTMANAVATGESWLKTFEVKTKAKVLFIDKESTIRRLQNRMKGLRITGKDLFFLEYPQWFSLAPDREDEEFSNFALKIQKFVQKNDIGLIVIDSFTDVMLGNENVAGDVQVFFDGFRQLLPGKAFIVLHHASKPSAGVTRTSSQKTRGSTNINAQQYSGFFVEKIPKKNHEYSFEHIKFGDTDQIKKFKIEMEVHADFYDSSKTQVINLKYGGEIEDEEIKSIHAEDIILDALGKKGQMYREELENVCIAHGISKRTFQNVLKKLNDDEIVTKDKDPQNKHKILIRLI